VLLFTLRSRGRAEVSPALHRIGWIEAGREVVLTGDDGERRPLPDLGWDHLAATDPAQPDRNRPE
jgi:hypothetical protein